MNRFTYLIVEQCSVTLRRHSAFAVCFQASALSNSLRHSCYQTSTTSRCQLSRIAQGRPPILPSERLQSGGLCYTASFAHTSSELFWTLPLARFLLPLIFSVSNYLCPDRLFWFFFLIWLGTKDHAHLTKESMGVSVVLKCRNATVGQFLCQQLLSSISEKSCAPECITL